MQTTKASTRFGITTLALLAFSNVPGVAAELNSEASLDLVRNGSNTQLTIQAPANGTWVIEHSVDLKSWAPLTTWKVHNGSFGGTIEAEGFGFLRTFLTNDLSGSTTAEALRLPTPLPNYAAQPLPPHFLRPIIVDQDNTPTNNAITDAGATLGRVLFYDKRLSANGTVSCSSCHQPQHGFSDPRKFSVGFEGGLTGRNSMGLTQARYYPRERFFWDERAATLENQVLEPIQNQVEVGMTLPALVTRLGAESFYTNLFERTFGTPEVTTNRISRALAQFIRSIVSTQSKYDQGVGNNFANFTAQEQLGRQIFLGQVGNATCATCHGTDNFVPNALFNNGLENPYVDKGVGALTGAPQAEGLFKVPSLRNIELTAPYMHDGRFATLEEVVEFYNSGVVSHPNLAPQLRVPTGPGQPPGPPRRLNLTADQKTALVAFLKTLTDTNLVNSPRFSDPFNYGAQQ